MSVGCAVCVTTITTTTTTQVVQSATTNSRNESAAPVPARTMSRRTSRIKPTRRQRALGATENEQIVAENFRQIKKYCTITKQISMASGTAV